MDKKEKPSRTVRWRSRCGDFFFYSLRPWLAYSERISLSEKILKFRRGIVRLLKSEWITTRDELTFLGIVLIHTLILVLVGYLIPKLLP